MANEAKLAVVAVVALVVVSLSLMLMPWAESGFGFDKTALPVWSQPIFENEPFTSLKPLGDWAQKSISDALAAASHVDKDDQNAKGQSNPFLAGDYTYAMVMGLAMVLAALAIMFVGKEDAEEKLILPAKK